LNSAIQGRFTASAGPAETAADTSPTIASAVPREESFVPKKKDRFSLIKHVSTDTFVDLIVHVVKTFPEEHMFQLYVTDYTVNKELSQHGKQSDDEAEDAQGVPGDEMGYISNRRAQREWTGPSGQRTLQVALWHPHGDFAKQNVKVDSYVALHNVHIKTIRTGIHYGKMEGIIHADRRYPNKICVRLIDDDDDDPRVIELKKRKREYWKNNNQRKTQLSEDFGEGPQGGSSKKNAKKKRKEQQQQQKKQEPPKLEEGQVEITSALNNDVNKLNNYSMGLSLSSLSSYRSLTGLTVRAIRPYVPCRSISAILSNESHNTSLPGGIEYRLPFQNLSYRTTVRVVDFFPPNIENFAVLYNPESAMQSDCEAEDSGDDNETKPMINGSAYQRRSMCWEWRFCLLVEDAKIAPGQPRDRIKLFVRGNDAVHLLKLDAVEYVPLVLPSRIIRLIGTMNLACEEIRASSTSSGRRCSFSGEIWRSARMRASGEE
jgi:hypothetical protein